MLGGNFRRGVFRFVAWALIVALCFPLGLPFGAKKAEAAADSLLVAVAGLENQTGRDILPGDYGIGAIISAATRVDGIELIPADKTLSRLDGEPDEEKARAAAEALGADMALFGRITALDFQNNRNALVTVELYLYSAGKDGTLLSKAKVTGASGEKFGYEGQLASLADEALRNAVEDSVESLFDNLSDFGMVTMTGAQGIFTDFTTGHGVTPGSELAVVRDYEQIATLKVDESKSSHTSARIVTIKPGYQVERGDKVRVVYRPQVFAQPEKQEIKKKKKLNPIVIGVLAVGVIVALTRGKGKADDAVKQQKVFVSRSTDGVAYIYAKNGFTTNYTPKVPQKKDINSTALATCYNIDTDCVWNGATNSNCGTQIYVVDGSTYEYSLASNPKNTTLPAGWNIAVDMKKFPNIPATSDTANKVKFAQCNATTGEWDILGSTYGANSTLNLTQAISTPVTHFSPYVVIVDARPDPISPTTVSVSDCGSTFLTLSWIQSSDPDFGEYEIFNCDNSSSASCGSTYTAISTASTTELPITGLIDDTEYCYAIRVRDISATGIRDSGFSNVVCAKPSATCEITGGGEGEITLVSPANSADITEANPTFVFIGSGDSDKYTLNVTGESVNEDGDPIPVILFSESIDGEGSENTGSAEIFDITYGGPNFEVDDQYTWQVIGTNAATGAQKESQIFSFHYRTGGTAGTGTSCNISVVPLPPVLVTPNNGAQIAVETPTFLWQTAANATSYTITVYNAQTQIVYQKNLTANIDTGYSGDPLKNNETYFWTVRSHTDCAASLESAFFQFTKISTDVAPLPAPEWVDPTTDGKSPITQIDGGDQYIVRLYWRQVNNVNLAGYNVYRCTEQGECTDRIAVIFKEQLTAPPPNPNCGSFTELSPGFCDISAENGMRHFYTITAFDNTQQDSDPTVPQNILLGLKRPTLISPGDVSSTEPNITKITTSSPLFNWQEVPGDNVIYLLRVTNENTGLIVWETTDSSSGIAYPSGITALVDENTYSWTVSAFNNLVTSDNSLTFYFKKKASSTKPDAPFWCDDPDATKCAAHPNFYDDPPNYSRNSITLYWQKVSGSDIQQYYIYRSTSQAGLPEAGEGSGNVIGVAQNNNCGTLTDIVCYEDRGDSGTGLERGQYYYYALKTVDSGGTTSLPSETRSVLNYSLVGAQLIYPANNQLVYEPQPTFMWLSELGADQYRIEVELQDGTWSANALYWVKTLTETEATYGAGSPPPRMPLENPDIPDAPSKTYHWRVCSINENYPSGKCDGSVFKFTKALKQPTPKYPTNSEPVSSDDVTFSWTASPGAEGYEIRLFWKADNSCTEGNQTVIAAPKIEGETTTSATLAEIAGTSVSLQKGQTYCWQIRAYDSYGAVSGLWSQIVERSKFVKVDAENPILTLPANDQIIGPNVECGTGIDMYGNYTYNYEMEFNWTAVTGATTYKIRVDEEVESPKLAFTTIWETTVGGTSQKNVNTNCQALGEQNPDPSGVILFSPGRVYRWNVATIDSDYVDGNARYFITGLPAPNLLEPFSGKEVVIAGDCDGLGSGGSICVHFDWDDIFGAGNYEIEIGSSNMYFRCEPGTVPAAATGTTPVNTSSCDMSTAAMDNGDIFSWRVRARDSNTEPNIDGNPGPWSTYWNFVVLVPAPVLASPPNSMPEPGGCVSAASTQGFAPVENNMCTTMPCQDPSFYWSPIPLANPCYKVQVSDTEDFRNIIFEDNNATGNYLGKCAASMCNPLGNCCNTDQADLVPMVNGVVYYWRVGASVAKTGGSCGVSWTYSAPYTFYKVPPSVPNVSFKDLAFDTVTVTWVRPTNCDGDAANSAKSTPIVPDDANATLAAYLIYMDTSGNFPEGCTPPDNLVGRVAAGQTEWTPPAGLVEESSDYVFCVVVRDNSGVENWAGSMSCPTCVFVTTPEDPAGGP